MTTNGFDRALRYFFRQSELYVLATIGGSIIMTAYMWLFIGHESLSTLMNSLPVTMLYISFVILFSIAASASQYWYPMLISFGCRRKNIFYGHLTMVTLFIIEILVIYEITASMLHTGILVFRIPTVLALYLIIEGISTLLNIAMVKWGKIVNTFIIMAIIAVSMCFGFWLGFSGASEYNFIYYIFNKLASLQWIQLFVGAIVCLAANIANYRILNRYEVRA